VTEDSFSLTIDSEAGPQTEVYRILDANTVESTTGTRSYRIGS
jgi:hypothetical protein